MRGIYYNCSFFPAYRQFGGHTGTMAGGGMVAVTHSSKDLTALGSQGNWPGR